MIDQIVDLIVREALSRGGDLPAKIAAIRVEVGIKLMEIMVDYREGKRAWAEIGEMLRSSTTSPSR